MKFCKRSPSSSSQASCSSWPRVGKTSIESGWQTRGVDSWTTYSHVCGSATSLISVRFPQTSRTFAQTTYLTFRSTVTPFHLAALEVGDFTCKIILATFVLANSIHTVQPHECCMLALRLGVGLVNDRSRVQIPAGPFSCNRSTQPCILPGSLNRVPTSAEGKGGIHTSVGWQVTLCDPIWHVSSP